MFETAARMEYYTAFGLQISSDFYFSELPRVDCNRNNFEADLVIKKVDSISLDSTKNLSEYSYYVEENLCIYIVPGVAIFKIENGRIISYSPMDGSNDDQIRLYLLGTCMGCALMQRKVLPIHGSAIAIYGKAYAIVGDSGAGKSTLASAFINRGFQLLTDDVIAVSLSDDNIPYVTPSYPQQKLWQESLDRFGIESNQFRPIYGRETKFTIPVTGHYTDEPMPLAGIFELNITDLNDIEILPVKKLERFPVLFYNTYRNFLIGRSGLMDWHFEFSANMINQLDFYRLMRPHSRFTANELVDHLLDLIESNRKTGTVNVMSKGKITQTTESSQLGGRQGGLQDLIEA